MKAHFILYVEDQDASTAFFENVLDADPVLYVPGMTEFRLSEEAVLGIMPVAGIRRLLGGRLPEIASGVKAELYVVVEDAGAHHERALAAGARELSPLTPRDWGHVVAYSVDPDGHVLAFAEVPAAPFGSTRTRE